MDFFNVRKWVVSMVIISILMSSLVYAEEKAAKKAAEPAEPKAVEAKTPPPENAAIVNGKPIPYSVFAGELEDRRRRIQRQGQPVPDQMLPVLRSQVLDNLINIELLLQVSAKKGIKVKEEDVDKEMAAIKERFKDNYEATLADMKLTEKTLRQQVSQSTTIRKLVDTEIKAGVVVKDEEAKNFYDKNPNYFQKPEQVHARHILIKVGSDATDKDKAEARKKIDAIKKRIDKGEDFGELAKTESEGPSNTKGGDLGFFSKGRMVKEFEDVAFVLKKNEVSDVVTTKFGYHLIQTLDHKDAETMAFNDVKERIITNLQNEKLKTNMQDYVENLRKKAEIKRFVD